MNLGVDDTGQDGQAGRVHGLAGRGLGQVADLGDATVAHAKVGPAAPGVVHHLAATDDQVIEFGHRAALRCWRCHYINGGAGVRA